MEQRYCKKERGKRGEKERQKEAEKDRVKEHREQVTEKQKSRERESSIMLVHWLSFKGIPLR